MHGPRRPLPREQTCLSLRQIGKSPFTIAKTGGPGPTSGAPCSPPYWMRVRAPLRWGLKSTLDPASDGFVGGLDAALGQEFLDIAVAQREAKIEPRGMPD